MNKWLSADRLSKFGLVITVVYFAALLVGIPIAAYYTLIEMNQLKLNELGDFLAGAFGPLAIFWLVLGFFQQGHELRLQVQELALSVEQQKELVGVSRDTLEHERYLADRRETERKAALRPKFVVLASGGSSRGGKDGYAKNNIIITNSGHSVSEVKISFEPSPFSGGFSQLPYWETGRTENASIQFNESGPLSHANLIITYHDAENRLGKSIFSLSAIDGQPMKLAVEPLAV